MRSTTYIGLAGNIAVSVVSGRHFVSHPAALGLKYLGGFTEEALLQQQGARPGVLYGEPAAKNGASPAHFGLAAAPCIDSSFGHLGR